MKVKYTRLVATACYPKKAHPSDAGFDLTCTSVEPVNDMYFVHTGIAVEIPKGYVGLLFPRSSVYKTGLELANSVGVIDSGYRGEIRAVFRASSDHACPYKEGDKCCQLVILKLPDVEMQFVTKLSTSDRGEKGFGSTDEGLSDGDSAAFRAFIKQLIGK